MQTKLKVQLISVTLQFPTFLVTKYLSPTLVVQKNFISLFYHHNFVAKKFSASKTWWAKAKELAGTL